ncbi:MAG TPA: PepSY domain-containing protein [Thermoanaerobaculia bacterium]|nr:PepSY domain-containing protein [Thermoanaerobaculia bacterium]
MRTRSLIVALLLVCTVVPTAFAFDARRAEQALDAKALALPPLKANFDATKAQLYLANPVWSAWNLAHGGNWTAQFDTLTNHPRRVYGGAIPFTTNAADLERVARSFIASNSTVLGVTNDRLTFVPEASTAVRSGKVMYAAFDYAIAGVPVEHARLVFAVNNGNMIYWHNANIADVPVVTTPVLTAAQALTAVLAHAGIAQSSIVTVKDPALKLLPRSGVLGALLKYQLVYEVVFRVDGGRSTWAAYVDALTGTVLAFGDTNRYADCTAGTSGKVTGGIRPAQATDAEVVRSFPFAAVSTTNGAQTANSNGGFPWGGGVASTGLNGTYFDTSCEDCVKSESDPQGGFQPYAESSNGRINLGTGGHDVVSGPDIPTVSYGNGTSTPADRTAFFHTNVARQIALKWLDLPFLHSKVTVKVNINDVCNAFWDGTALNFFKAGDYVSGSNTLHCKNTGEIRDVMQHEWGHGLDDNDGEAPGYAEGFGDMATGEAAADHIALFVDHDSCIGQSFYNFGSGPFVTDANSTSISTCDGVRNVDELRTSSGRLTTTNVTVNCAAVSTQPYYVGPLLGEGHCEGELWGQVDWHLVQDLMSGRKYGTQTLDANKQFVTYAGDALPPSADGSANGAFDRDVAWTILERLYFESRPLVASYAPSRFQAMGASAYDGFMVVDDEGDGLANGTPHAAYINDAYVHHGAEEWATGTTAPSVASDTKNCAAPGTPSVTLTQTTDSATGTPAVTITWTAVAGATSYSVLRTERRDDVFLELARVNTGNSITDVGVDNGVTYYYRVQANSNTACWSVSAGGVKSIAIAQPEPALNNVTINDSQKGNNDGTLDAGEQAKLFVVIRNSGLGALTNVTATLRSLTQGITVTSAGPYSYGSVAVGATAGPSASYAIIIDPNGMLCGTTAQFVLDIKSDQGCFALPVPIAMGDASSSCFVYRKPFAQPQSIAIISDKLNSCGDGDGTPDPGELVQITVAVNNTGDKTANNVVVKLTSDRPYFVINNDTVNVGSIAPLAAETKNITFTVSVGNAPFADVATFSASVTSSSSTTPATRTLATVVNRDLKKQSVTYTFDSSDEGWSASGWARESAPTTGDLTTVFHALYGSNVCQTLTSPVVEFSPTSAYSFDLAYVSENTDGAYDGTTVEISVDGGYTWRTVDVAQGYPVISASTGCVAAGTPFFSGVSPTMTHYDVDLSAYAGRTGQLRFRFGSDELVNADPAGTWVDNITAKDIVVSVPDVACQ